MFDLGLEKVSFHSSPKKGNTKVCSNYYVVLLISHASNIMLKILQLAFSSMGTKNLDVQTGFQGGRGARDQIANIHGIMEKAKEFQNNIYFCFIDYTKNFVWITTNWKILKEMEIATHLTCLLRNLYAGQE